MNENPLNIVEIGTFIAARTNLQTNLLYSKDRHIILIDLWPRTALKIIFIFHTTCLVLNKYINK